VAPSWRFLCGLATGYFRPANERECEVIATGDRGDGRLGRKTAGCTNDTSKLSQSITTPFPPPYMGVAVEIDQAVDRRDRALIERLAAKEGLCERCQGGRPSPGRGFHQLGRFLGQARWSRPGGRGVLARCLEERAIAAAVGTGSSPPPASVRRWRERLSQRWGSLLAVLRQIPVPSPQRTLAVSHPRPLSRLLGRLALRSQRTIVGWAAPAAASATGVAGDEPGSSHCGEGQFHPVRKTHIGHSECMGTHSGANSPQPGKTSNSTFFSPWLATNLLESLRLSAGPATAYAASEFEGHCGQHRPHRGASCQS